MTGTFLLSLIVACEVGFWAFLVAGLCARYFFRRPRLSTILLFCVPAVDLVLLGATVLDLQRGSAATFVHGLAAAYIGFTVAFGSLTIRWIDRHFAHRFAGGSTPEKMPTFGRELFCYEMKLWGRCVLAVAITVALVFAAIVFVDHEERTREIELWLTLPLGTAIFWFLLGPLWSLVFNWLPRQNSPDEPG